MSLFVSAFILNVSECQHVFKNDLFHLQSKRNKVIYEKEYLENVADSNCWNRNGYIRFIWSNFESGRTDIRFDVNVIIQVWLSDVKKHVYLAGLFGLQ